MGLDYSFKLYFRNEDVEKALLALADMVWIDQNEYIHVVLPNRKKIKIALGTSKHLLFSDDESGVIARVDTSLTFLLDDEISNYFQPFKHEGYNYTVEQQGKIYYRIGYIWLKIRHSKQYAEFSFMAVTTDMSLLFVKSRSIHQRFLELLNAANGILGIIDVESWEYLLLDHPERGVFLDQTQFYDEVYDPDVDWFVSNILELKRLEEPIWQRQNDPASFRRKWITPFPSSLINRDLLFHYESEQMQFWTQMQALMPEATDEVIELLLDDLNRRYSLIGAYFAAFRRQDKFAEHIGKAMILYPYNANTYCFALARLGSLSATAALESYLQRYIPINEQDPVWDDLSIDWAIAALQHIDEQIGTQRAKNYTTDDGVWDRWAGWKIKPARQDLNNLLELAQKYFR